MHFGWGPEKLVGFKDIGGVQDAPCCRLTEGA